RIRQGREIVGRKTITWHGAFSRITEIVILVAAVIDTKTGADRGPAVEGGRRPGHTQPRSEVFCVGIVIRRTVRTEAPTSADIYHCRAVQNFMHHRIIFVTQSKIESE